MKSISTNRRSIVKVLCAFCMVLMCVMGVVQATHSHADSSSTAHHACSICATAHTGISTQTVASAPVFATSALTVFVADSSAIFRPAATQFIRPPPAF